MFTEYGVLLLTLFAGHYLVDFALQTSAMDQGKNRRSVPKQYDPVIHGPLQRVWLHYLTAHASIHGLVVGIVLNPTFGVIEYVLHWLIDVAKCERWFGIHTDQILHLLCKVVYVAVILRWA